MEFTREELVMLIHESKWDWRVYGTAKGIKFQVFATSLIHVAEVETKEEAERLCSLHNEALDIKYKKG